MNILDDLKLQYKIGGIALRVIYWNVACFLISLVFFYQYSGGGFAYPDWLALSSNPNSFYIQTLDFFNLSFFHS